MKRRSALNLLGLTVGILVMVLVFRSLSTMLFQSNHGISNHVESDLPIAIKSVLPDKSGKIELTLSIDIEDILQRIGGHEHPSGEATANQVPRDTAFVKNVPNLCKDSPDLKYVVYIHTSPGNEKRRATVRRTWGDANLFRDGRLKVVFMAGTPEDPKHQEILDQEHEKYHDIVQGDFIDSYHNLTLKAVMGLKWVSTFCRSAKFAIKADDDAFVNIFRLLDMIEKHNDPNRVVMCPIWGENTMPILRDPAKCMKWCVKYSEFPGKTHFPQYCAGLTYVFSNDIVSEMYQLSKSTPFFWIDDVYITGILAKKLSKVHYVNFMNNFTLKEKLAMEDYFSTSKSTRYMVVHLKNNDTWKSMWDISLNRVTDTQLKTLSSRVIEENPNLSNRWKSLQ